MALDTYGNVVLVTTIISYSVIYKIRVNHWHYVVENLYAVFFNFTIVELL